MSNTLSSATTISPRRKVYPGTYDFTSSATGKTYEAVSSYDGFYRVGLWTIYEVTFDPQRPTNRMLSKRGPELTTVNLLKQVPAAIEGLEAGNFSHIYRKVI